MTMTTSLRKFALPRMASVGWLGAVAGFLALALAGATSRDLQMMRAAYLAMDLTYRSVIVPLGLASLLTGLVSTLGTEWGLFRHYWVLVKLLLTIPLTILLLVHVQPVSAMAGAVLQRTFSVADLSGLRIQLAAHAAAALLALLVATTLSVYRPRGATGYRARRLHGA